MLLHHEAEENQAAVKCTAPTVTVSPGRLYV